MASADTEKSYGGLERFIFIILLPILFTVLLTGVLLTLFDYDVKNIAVSIGKKIPIVERFVPDEEAERTAVNPASERIRLEEEIRLLTAESERKIAELENELQIREERIARLEESLEKMIVAEEAVAVGSEQYRSQLKELSDMYAAMTPRRAADILQNLEMPELVLLLYEMRAEDRGRILERMNPETAATASIQLKDIHEGNRSQWEEEARRARESLTAQANSGEPQKLGIDELAQTFAAMTPASAASVLLELSKTSSSKVVAILNAMDIAPRSALMTAIGQLSPEDAASIAGQLGL